MCRDEAIAEDGIVRSIGRDSLDMMNGWDVMNGDDNVMPFINLSTSCSGSRLSYRSYFGGVTMAKAVRRTNSVSVFDAHYF